MTVYIEPTDVDDLIASVGFHVRDRNLLLSALAADSVSDGDEFVRSVADHQVEFIEVANWIETHSTRL